MTMLGLVALGCAALAGAMQVFFLVRRPMLSPTTKVFLFVALGPLPTTAVLTGNQANIEVTKERRFCGSCHVMGPFARDAGDVGSHTLASAHSRNPAFGDQSCYSCHADYEMFGTITTKLDGMGHVWNYYVGGWREAPPSKRPRIAHPFSDATCTHCHSRQGPRFEARLEHAVHARAFTKGRVHCTNAACHGPAHPPPVAP